MEKECLALLLRGRQPVVVAPARAIGGYRLPAGWKAPLADNRLLIVSPFEPRARRTTAALADAILIIHAEPGGAVDALAGRALADGRTVLTLESAANGPLLERGARALGSGDIVEYSQLGTGEQVGPKGS
jgi:hypothetical protein